MAHVWAESLTGKHAHYLQPHRELVLYAESSGFLASCGEHIREARPQNGLK